MTKSTSKRGGYRPGSGRPPLPPEMRRERTVVYVKPETRSAIRDIKARGLLTRNSLGNLIDLYIQNLTAGLRKEGKL